MNRRDFFKTTAGVTLATGATGATAHAGGVQPAARNTPAVLGAYSAGDHRRRLQNIGFCERAIRACMRKHLITDYLPGHCVYNLGEYPARKPWNPDDWDERELDKLRDHGIQLIQLHDDCNDAQRGHGDVV